MFSLFTNRLIVKLHIHFSVTRSTGTALSGCHYTHPLKSSDRLPLLAGHHVTTDKGTGLVHTAPVHGQEDFQIAVNNGLTLVSN